MQTPNLNNSLITSRDHTGCGDDDVFDLWSNANFDEIIKETTAPAASVTRRAYEKKKRSVRSTRIFIDRHHALLIPNSHYLKMNASQVLRFLDIGKFEMKQKIWYSILCEANFNALEMKQSKVVRSVIKKFKTWNMTLDYGKEYVYYNANLGLTIKLPHRIALNDWCVEEKVGSRLDYVMEMNVPNVYGETKKYRDNDTVLGYPIDELEYFARHIHLTWDSMEALNFMWACMMDNGAGMPKLMQHDVNRKAFACLLDDYLCNLFISGIMFFYRPLSIGWLKNQTDFCVRNCDPFKCFSDSASFCSRSNMWSILERARIRLLVLYDEVGLEMQCNDLVLGVHKCAFDSLIINLTNMHDYVSIYRFYKTFVGNEEKMMDHAINDVFERALLAIACDEIAFSKLMDSLWGIYEVGGDDYEIEENGEYRFASHHEACQYAVKYEEKCYKYADYVRRWFGRNDKLKMQMISGLVGKVTGLNTNEILKSIGTEMVLKAEEVSAKVGVASDAFSKASIALEETAAKVGSTASDALKSAKETIGSWDFQQVFSTLKDTLTGAWKSILDCVQDKILHHGLDIIELVKNGVVAAINTYVFVTNPDPKVKALMTLNILNLVPLSAGGIVQEYLNSWFGPKPEPGEIQLTMQSGFFSKFGDVLGPLLVSTLAIFGRIPSFDFTGLCRNISLLGNAIRGLKTIVEVVPTFTNWLLNRLEVWWYGYDPILNQNQNTERWAAMSIKIINDAYRLPMRVDMQIALNHLIRRGYALLETTPIKDATVRNGIQALITPMTKLAPSCLSYYVDQKTYRPPAFVFNFFGDPGVGKTALIESVLVSIMTTLFGPGAYMNELYRRVSGNDYWDNYRNEFAVIYDDLGQSADSAGKPNEEVLEIIRSANICPFNLHMPDIESKGKVFFNSAFIASSSNKDPFNYQFPSITCRGAFERRFNLVFKILERRGNDEKLEDRPKCLYRIQLAHSNNVSLKAKQPPADVWLTGEEIATLIFHTFLDYYKKQATIITNLINDSEKYNLMGPISAKVLEMVDVLYDLEDTRKVAGVMRNVYEQNLNTYDAIMSTLSDVEVKGDFVGSAEKSFQAMVQKQILEQSPEVELQPQCYDLVPALQLPTGEISTPELKEFVFGEGVFKDVPDGLENKIKLMHINDEGFMKFDELDYKELDRELNAYSRTMDNVSSRAFVDYIYKVMSSYFGSQGQPLHKCVDTIRPEIELREPPFNCAQAAIYLRFFGFRCPHCLAKLINFRYLDHNNQMKEWRMGGEATVWAARACLMYRTLVSENVQQESGSVNNKYKDPSGGLIKYIQNKKSGWAGVFTTVTAAFTILGSFGIAAKIFTNVKSATDEERNQNSHESDMKSESTDLVARRNVKRTIKDTASRVRPINRNVMSANNTVVSEVSKLPQTRVKLSRNSEEAQVQIVNCINTIEANFPIKDGNCLDQVNCVLNQMVDIMVASSGIHVLYGMLIDDHTLLVPLHLAELIEDENKNQVLLRMKSVNGMTHEFKLQNLKCEVIRDKDGEETDAMLVALDMRFMGFRDLKSRFCTESNLCAKLKSYALYVTLLNDVKQDRLIPQILVSNQLALSSRKEYETTYQGQEIEYIIPRSWEYFIPTTRGSCGSVVLAYNRDWANKIIGIHVAGSEMVGRGISPVLTQETIVQAYNNLYDHKPQLQCYLPNFVEDVFGPVLVENILCEGVESEQGTRLIGRCARKSAQPENDIIPSPLHNWSGLPIKTKPAHVRPFVDANGTRVDPVGSALKKVALGDKYIEPGEVAEAVHSYKNMLANCKFVDADRRVLTIEEGFFGVDDDPYMRPMAWNTSAGLPWKWATKLKGKRDLVRNDNNERWINPLLNNAVQKRLADIKNHKLEIPICEDIPKVERRPIPKVDAGKTRIFNTLPLDFNCLIRMYFGKFVSWFMANNPRNESAIGINPLSLQWTELANLMSKHGDNCVAGDFSNYDGTENRRILEACLDVINWWYGDECEEDNYVRSVLFQGLMGSVHLCGHVIYGCHHSNPSGNPLTSILNTMYNSISMRIVWQKLAPPELRHRFRDYVSFVAYGDDNLLNISDHVKSWFNQETISKAYAEIGMVYTDENKQGISDFRKLSEVSFLKRSFRKEGGIFYAPLDIDSLLEIPCWQSKSNGPEELTSSLLSMGPELVQYGSVFFKKWMDKLRSVCMHTPGVIAPNWLSYQAYHLEMYG